MGLDACMGGAVMTKTQWIEFLFAIILKMDPEGGTELWKVYEEEHGE